MRACRTELVVSSVDRLADNPATLIDTCRQELLRRKLEAVWRWADPMVLERIQDALFVDTEPEEVCKMLVGSNNASAPITKEQLEAAKHSKSGVPLVEVVFERQLLPLCAPEAGCLDFLCAC